MTALDAFLQASGQVATVLTLCFGQPAAHGDRGCITAWEAPGRHLVECRIRAVSAGRATGDRTQCAVVPMDREKAAHLFVTHGTCTTGAAFPVTVQNGSGSRNQ